MPTVAQLTAKISLDDTAFQRSIREASAAVSGLSLRMRTDFQAGGMAFRELDRQAAQAKTAFSAMATALRTGLTDAAAAGNPAAQSLARVSLAAQKAASQVQAAFEAAAGGKGRLGAIFQGFGTAVQGVLSPLRLLGGAVGMLSGPLGAIGSVVLGVVGPALSGLVGILGSVASTALNAAQALGNVLLSAASSAFGTILSLARGAALAAGAAGAAIGFMGVKANEFRENTLMSLTAMTKSKAVAQDLFGFFDRLSDVKPFSADEIVSAGRQLLAFGFDAKKTLSMVTDVGFAMKVPLEQVVGVLARAKAGMFEMREAAAVGLSRQALMGYGVQMNEHGQIENPAALLPAIQKFFQTRFGGASNAAGTWQGATTTLTSNLKRIARTATEGFFASLKEAMGTLNTTMSAILSKNLPLLQVLRAAFDHLGQAAISAANSIARVAQNQSFVTGLASALGVAGRMLDYFVDRLPAAERWLARVFDSSGYRAFLRGLEGGFNLAVSTVGNAISWITGHWDQLWGSVQSAAETGIGVVLKIWGTLAPNTSGIFDALIVGWQDLWFGFQDAAQFGGTLVIAAVQAMNEVLFQKHQALGVNWAALWSGMKVAVKGAVTVIGGVIAGLGNVIMDLMTPQFNVQQGFKSIGAGIKQLGVATVGVVGEMIRYWYLLQGAIGASMVVLGGLMTAMGNPAGVAVAEQGWAIGSVAMVNYFAAAVMENMAKTAIGNIDTSKIGDFFGKMVRTNPVLDSFSKGYSGFQTDFGKYWDAANASGTPAATLPSGGAGAEFPDPNPPHGGAAWATHWNRLPNDQWKSPGMRTPALPEYPYANPFAGGSLVPQITYPGGRSYFDPITLPDGTVTTQGVAQQRGWLPQGTQPNPSAVLGGNSAGMPGVPATGGVKQAIINVYPGMSREQMLREVVSALDHLTREEHPGPSGY